MRRPSRRFHTAVRRLAHLVNSSSVRFAVSYSKLAKRQQQIWALFNPVVQGHVKLRQNMPGTERHELQYPFSCEIRGLKSSFVRVPRKRALVSSKGQVRRLVPVVRTRHEATLFYSCTRPYASRQTTPDSRASSSPIHRSCYCRRRWFFDLWSCFQLGPYGLEGGKLQFPAPG